MKNAIVLGYYPDWVENTPPSKLDFSIYTHIAHAFAGVEKDGAVKLPDAKQVTEVVRRAHAAGVKVILSLGGADSNRRLSERTATDSDLRRLADRLAQAVTQNQYDGIDVDWEAPENATDQARMNGLVKALRERLPKSLITMAVPSGDWSGKWYARDALLPYVDCLNVMTYDFSGPWEDHAGHNSSLPDTMASMDYWEKRKGWPREKLLLGIPLYGRGFKAAKFGDPAKGNYERSELSYNDTLALIRQGWRSQRDSTAQVPYLVSPDGKEVVSYEDATSAKQKGAYARQRNLAGIFFWDITQDFDGKTNVLVRAARDGWG